MDIDKEKLKSIRKRREIISKQRDIELKWQELEKDEDLTRREKLEKLIYSELKKEEEKAEKEEKLIDLPSKVQIFEHVFPSDYVYGGVPIKYGFEISGNELYYLSQSPEFKNIDLSSSLFLDLETTGLSIGTGTIPFLIGLGFYLGDKFCIIQYFLPQPSEEEELIDNLNKFLSEMNFKSIITYNGRGFDLPILETRFILNRKNFSLKSFPHLDFLIPARILWKQKYRSCKLSHLCRELLGVLREDDIPSSLIPNIYFNYLRSGDFSLIEKVLYHNEQDLLSLLSLIIIGGLYFKKERKINYADGLDFFGVGRLLEKNKALEECMEAYNKALNFYVPQSLEIKIKKKLSYFYKKTEQWEKAIALWEELAFLGEVHPLRELAIYYEHREKNLIKAKEIVERALDRGDLSEHYRKDFEKRLIRLDRKLRKFF
ncbi:ribonuclease H-like domain-containing protein [SCandidatus Aminicenantes bacterium Aminicenantia_JdfR_composite]|jgi:hypothetical protein|nr:ribonuclease H-like domain-containing protein [SCandidatus Aminicenantes bacterium Aminicenantia_JdfR_composite]MCP2597228.1 ribonuclease H-like domain-containing protein [Candidatus Aminicenantes bacterium AC-335-G13]MCP2597726.1 ribonuclease H-like domain-containing protein [Candidatus Aminicenantes bacterium AC-335-L06]MCP2620893.1 ribonuclease H-like domain-containing protein [Candidatus Aminicenantes bacterium AC-334-E05]